MDIEFIEELKELMIKYDIHTITPMNIDGYIKVENDILEMKYMKISTNDLVN